MACSPGGRFCRLSLIFTPWAAADRVAVPTLWPWAFCRFTVFGAALAPLAKTGITARKIMVVSITANLWVFEVIILQVPPLSFACALSNDSKDCIWICAAKENLARAEDHFHWQDDFPSWNG